MQRPLKVFALVWASAVSGISQAHEHYFSYTYDWFTPLQFEREIELHWTQFPHGDFKSELEYEYGVTDRYVISPYLLFEHSGGVTRFNGWKVEQRYRFGDRGMRRTLPAAYLEIEKENDERAVELEGKLIGTYLPSRDLILSGNLIVTRKLAAGERFETGYSLGVARKLAFNEHIGFEAFGNWTTNQHFIGPSFGYGRPHTLKVVGTFGFPLNGGGSQFRLNLEKEF